LNSPIFSHALLSVNHGLSVNPLKFVQNFSKALEKNGIEIYENTPLIKITKNIAKTTHGKIKFKKMILAIDVAHPSKRVKNMKSTIVVTRHLNKNELSKTGFLEKNMFFIKN